MSLLVQRRPTGGQQVDGLEDLLKLNALLTRRLRVEQSGRVAAITVALVVVLAFVFVNSGPSQVLVFVPLLGPFGLDRLLVLIE